MTALKRTGRGNQLLTEQVRQTCLQIVDRLKEERAEFIDAKDVAHRAAAKFDRGHHASIITFAMSVEGIAQVARGLLRKCLGPEADDDDVTDEQLDAFATELQEHYSIKRKEFGGSSKYVLREQITKEEIATQVIPMLEKRQAAYAKHIDLLRSWNDARE